MPSLSGLKYLTLHLLASTSTVLSSPLSTSPSDQLPRSIASLNPGSGTHNGYYYTYWNDNTSGSVSYTNKEKGSYSVTWTKASNFFAGKGWGPSTTTDILNNHRYVSYSASKFNTTGNAYLSVYGMSRSSPANKPDGLVEFYIVENFGSYDPSSAFVGAQPGNGNALDGGILKIDGDDGGEYRIGVTRQFYWTPIAGTGSSMILRVYSVRQSGQRRSAGKVDLKKHFDAWISRLGVDVGSYLDFAIVAVEGYQSSGEAEVSVGEA